MNWKRSTLIVSKLSAMRSEGHNVNELEQIDLADASLAGSGDRRKTRRLRSRHRTSKEITMVNKVPKKKTKIGRSSDAKTPSKIRFTATLLRPASPAIAPGSWTFLNLPKQASAKLPSRSKVSVEGTINGSAFRATLEPDGNGGHWLKVDQTLREAAAAKVNDLVTLEITPLTPDQEPEPEVPSDLRKALASASQKAKDTWSDITPIARRDWIHWITSGMRAETRIKRINVAISKLSAGDRRPCCFDRSGMYDKSLSCPVAADDM
jgi:hypothetical protein